MATATRISSSIIRQAILSRRTRKHPLNGAAVRKLNQLGQAETRLTPQLTYMAKAMKRKSLELLAVPPSTSIFITDSLSPAQSIMQFYSAINEKNLKELDKLIAENCFFDDYSFPKPFQGKKEVLHFLEQLTMCMGDDRNMQFYLEDICEGNDYTVAVNWHLDWKQIQVPFTRGISYYSLSVNGDKLVIEKAQVLIESPVKLGAVALTIFRILSSLFDAFPEVTKWFLKSPHIVFRLLLKAYNICIQPIISPFLGWYIELLSLAAWITSFTLKILYYLTKIFHK